MDDPLKTRLETVADGLLYSSESDRPFTYVRFDQRTDVASLSPAAVAELLGQSGARADERSLDQLLAQHLNGDPNDLRSRELAPRYAQLVDTLCSSFPLIRVFRVGTIEMQVLLLGNDPANGILCGLCTVAVET